MPLNGLQMLDDPMGSELEVIDVIACNFVEEVYSSLASNDADEPLSEGRPGAYPDVERH